MAENSAPKSDRLLGADGDWSATLEDGSRVSAKTLRRVACDCGLLATGGGDGEALNIGRRSRSIPPAIRRALMLRDRGCAFPGCTHTAFLHGHHVEHWLHGGQTSLTNLVMLCTFHHHLVHEGGWAVSPNGDGSFAFESAAGYVSAPLPPQEAVAEDAWVWLEQWANDHGLAIGPKTNAPKWDGKPIQHSNVVEWLLDAG